MMVDLNGYKVDLRDLLSPLRDQNGHVVALKVVDPHRHKNFEYL